MNTMLLIEGLIEIVVSVVTGVLFFFLSFRFFDFLTRDIEEGKEIKGNNIAVSILVTSFIFGIMWLVKSSAEPALEMLKSIMIDKGASLGAKGGFLVRVLAVYFITAILSFVILWFIMRFFMLLTRDIDEMKLIKENNISIAFMMATVIISITLILLQPVRTILESLLSYNYGSKLGIKEPFINIPVLLQGLVQLAVSILGGLVVFFLSFNILGFATRDIDEIEELKKDNIAVSILACSFIIGIMILVRAAIMPANDALSYIMSAEETGAGDIIFGIVRVFFFFLITCGVAFLLIWLVMQVFMVLTTKIDEMKEIKNRNVAISIVVGVLIISAALLLEHGLTTFLSGLIETPDIGTGLIELNNL